MKKIISLLLCLTLSTMSVFQVHATPGDLADAKSGTYFFIPGAPGVPAVNVFDFDLDPVPGIGSLGSYNGGGDNDSGGSGTGYEDFEMAADIRGGQQLSRMIENDKADKEYRFQMEKLGANYFQALEKQPLKQSDIVDYDSSVRQNSSSQFDSSEEKDLVDHGQSFVFPSFKPYSQVLREFNAIGGHFSTGSTKEEYPVADLMDQVRNAEIHHYQRFVERGYLDTQGFKKRADKIAQRRTFQINKNFKKVKDQCVVPNSSYGPSSSPHNEAVQHLDNLLNQPSQSYSPQEDEAKGALRAILEALPGLPEDLRPEILKLLGKYAEKILNYTLGLDPATGTARSAYEALTGKNFVTGEKLTKWDRTFAIAGVVSVGLLSNLPAAMKGFAKLGEKIGISPSESRILNALADASSATGSKLIDKIRKWGERMPLIDGGNKDKILIDISHALEVAHGEMVIKEFYTAEELNQYHLQDSPGHQRPYYSHSYGVQGTLREDMDVLRFSEEPIHTGDQTVVKWAASPKDVDLRTATPEKIQKMYSLAKPPKYVSTISVPAGTPVLKTKTSSVFQGIGNVDQYQILRDIRSDRIKSTKPL